MKELQYSTKGHIIPRDTEALSFKDISTSKDLDIYGDIYLYMTILFYHLTQAPSHTHTPAIGTLNNC